MLRSVTGITLLRALKHRRFALVWSGQTVSSFGDYLYSLALAWWVLEETGSAGAMAAVLIFAYTPKLLFLLLGGVAGDRFSRPLLMLTSDLLRGVVVTVVAALAFAGLLEIWHVYLASLIFGFVDAFFQPAYAAMVPDIVPADDLPSANSLTSLSIQLGRIAGPALGATIVALGGTELAFAIDAITFFVSSAFLFPLLGLVAPRSPSDAGVTAARSPLADLREGIATVARSPWLWLSIIMFALTNVTLAGPYSIALPFLVKDHLKADVETLGLLYAIFPIGYILGGVWLGRKARLRRRGLLVYGGPLVAGLMLATFGLPLPVVVLALTALVNGAALEMGGLAWTSTLQDPTLVPRDRLGRVASIDMLGSAALQPIGYGLTGWVTELIGPAQTFLLGGTLTALIAALGLVHPQVRSVD